MKKFLPNLLIVLLINNVTSAHVVYKVTSENYSRDTKATGKSITVEQAETCALPELSTTYASDISITSATLGGIVIDDGGTPVTARGVVWSTNPNPTISDNKTSDGMGIGEFTSSLTGLEANTMYYVRAYATNTVGTNYGNEALFKTHYGTVADIDGNVYETVQIGEQIWMAENLRVTHFNDGTPIPLITDSSEWITSQNGYCWYNNDEETYKNPYGAIYKYDPTGLCPMGWHLPDYDEWHILLQYLNDGSSIGKLKEAGTEHWNSPNIGATNESGFTALPGGFRQTNGMFSGINDAGYFWKKLTYTQTQPSLATLHSNDTLLTSQTASLKHMEFPGGSVRCVLGKDTLPVVSTTPVSDIKENSVSSGGEISDDGGACTISRGVVWNTNPDQTHWDNYTVDGVGGGKFSSNLTGLQANTIYYVRAYARNNKGTSFGKEILFKTNYGSVTDIDGNTYGTVKIGTQVWMRENLRVTHFNDGTDIPLVVEDSSWSSANLPAYCWYNNDEDTNKLSYGSLYNVFAINTSKLCPAGWHVPSSEEWSTLVEYLGGEQEAGGKLKEADTMHWVNPNSGASNETGFTALPGGYRLTGGTFDNQGRYGKWWSSSSSTTNSNWFWYLRHNSVSIENSDYGKTGGFSVRCIEGGCNLSIELGEPIASCAGQTETLDAGAGFDSYLWGTGETTQTISVTESGTYSVTVAQGGCEASDDVEVTFNSLPGVELGEPIASCAGQAETLDAGAGFDSYLWGTGETTQTISVTESGTYSVTVAQGGCDNTDEILVSFNPQPVISLENDTTILTTDTLDITPGNGFASYLWNNGSTEEVITIQNESEGIYEYFVSVTDENGCVAVDTIIVTINLANSIAEYINNGSVKIYPNPTKDKVYIKSEKTIDSKIIIKIYEPSGRMLLSREYYQFDQNYDYEIDLSPFVDGIYLFRISDENEVKVLPIIKY